MKTICTITVIASMLLNLQANAQSPILQKSISEKNSGNSFALSLVAPGSGMMYNNQVGLGLATFFGVAILLAGGGTLTCRHVQNRSRP